MLHNLRRKFGVLALLLFVLAFIFPMARTQKLGETIDTTIDNNDSNEERVVLEKRAIFSDVKERFVAHRGYSAAAPENTTVAFELAGKSDFWGIETDICETSDGEFVCMHDETVNRTTDGGGYVSDFDFELLKTLKITAGENIDRYKDLKVPSMREYLDICQKYGCVPVIEIKDVRNYGAFLSVIYEYGLKNNCIVAGTIEDLKEIRKIDSEILVMIVGYADIEYMEYMRLLSEIPGDKGILYNFPEVTRDVAQYLKNQGIYCGVWSLDKVEEAKEYLSYGVDFVVTNVIAGRTDLMINTSE